MAQRKHASHHWRQLPFLEITVLPIFWCWRPNVMDGMGLDWLDRLEL